MKNWLHLPAAALVAGLVGFGSSLLSSPARGAARGADTSVELAGLRASLMELEQAQSELARTLATRPNTPAPARAPLQDLDQAIAAYMARQLTQATEKTPAASPGVDPEITALVDRIVLGQVKGEELELLWQRLREEKRIDAVVAEIERLAANAPNDPDMASELGKAYIQKLFDVGVGPLAGAWGEKADKAFDRALELDPEHQDARFEKAVALSNWPAFLGKQGEAARQFEILREQQERSAPRESHASTYFFLGNLYDQMGERDKAAAVWARGLELFPDNSSLRAKRRSN
jgi:tetratricopeptide (TPR) repeat protein